jgi:hypothetical protein
MSTRLSINKEDIVDDVKDEPPEVRPTRPMLLLERLCAWYDTGCAVAPVNDGDDELVDDDDDAADDDVEPATETETCVEPEDDEEVEDNACDAGTDKLELDLE